jgi:hypothetical protein
MYAREIGKREGLMKKLCIICCFILLVSCVTTKAVKLGTTTNALRPVVDWNNVAVYRTADQVPGKYEEVAMMVGTGESLWTSEAGMWKSLKKKAGALGANAIILDAMSEPSAGAKVAAAFLGVGGAQRKGKAIAIFVLPPEK